MTVDTNRKKGMIYALGELLIDLIPNEENMRISEPGAVLKAVSGSAAIFACAAQLLGGQAGFIGKIGRDSLSMLAVNTMRAQGVDMDCLVPSDEGQIGLAFLEYTPTGRNYQYYRTRSVGSLLRAEEVPEAAVAGAAIVHFPGMLLELTEEMRGACERLLDLAKRYGARVSFDPNLRRELGRGTNAMDRMLGTLRRADIVAPTLEEGRILTGEKTPGAVIRALHAMGPTVVALTMDQNGCIVSTGGRAAVAAGIPCSEVDPTGAGDTLAAALCVGLREQMSLEQLAAFCNCAGMLAVTKRGAIGTALPERSQVEQVMASGACPVTVMDVDSLD